MAPGVSYYTQADVSTRDHGLSGPRSRGLVRLRRRAGLIMAAVLVAGAQAGAQPKLEPPSPGDPASHLFHRPAPFGSLGKPGQPLLRRRSRVPMVEAFTSFEAKVVVVDSNGVHYTPMTSGFQAGPSVTLTQAEYITLGQAFTYQGGWQETVRQRMRRAAFQQMRDGRTRLEWRVPLPAPKPIRAIIGDEGSLSINGSHTAIVSGKSQWTEGEVQTLAGRPSAFPTLSMDQESQFAVEGAIGEAINIRITQDTESFGQAFGSSLRDQVANQVKLDYRGDEDDIFQEVQAGNTTLSLPSTRYVGFNQQHKGLFGIRAKGSLGRVGFTTIASHEKSESNRQTFRGGAQVDTNTVRDYNYLRNTYFFLDPYYRDVLRDFHEVATGAPEGYQQSQDIDENSLQVFINDFNVNNDAEQLARPGRALADLSRPDIDSTGYVETGTWHQLDRDNDYALIPQLGYIILRTAVQERHALAVSYRTRGGQQVGSVQDSLLLKLIKPRDARPEFPTWNLEWKNVYAIVRGFSRGKMFEEDKIRIEVLKEVPGREPENSQGGTSYLQVMGLDTHGQDPGAPPDRIIDADYIGLDPSRGVLIFPDLTPFDPQHSRYQVLKDHVPEIYTSQQKRDLDEASRYTIQVINSSAQQRISLTKGRLAGIDEESVDVRLNGKRLVRGVDYHVSYTGEVTFLGETQTAVADPGADLVITFESQDLLGIGTQQKTLLGLRGEYEFLQGDGMLGMTVLYNNVRSPDQRVRVGGEPARTVVWDLDMRASFEAPFLTRAVDALPLLKTAAASDVTVQAEVAQSRPNLNTRGAAYIDDFEGSERPELLSVYRTRWSLSSTPSALGFGADNRGRMIWYNPYDRVQRTEIWPGQVDQYEASNSDTDVLVMELAARAEATTTWNGLMTSFSGGVRDFSQSKFLEVWVWGTEGELHIDLGDIPEDWRRHDLSRLDSTAVEAMDLRDRLDSLLTSDGRLDTEDNPYPGRATGDGQVAPEEDVGIDRRNDAQELAFYLALAGVDTSGLSKEQRRARFQAIPEYADREAADPEGDNWDYDSSRNKGDYRHINGTEDNRLTEGGTRPDSEDLNNDGSLSHRNDYYHYTVDLALDEPEPDTESNGWRLYRLPLYGPSVVREGNPDSSRIEYARLVYSFAGMEGDSARVRIAQIEIIGNEWQEDDLVALGDFPVEEEESVDVAVIGTDENQGYSPPPGVRRRQLSGSRAKEREQSLVLDYELLGRQHQASATKVLTRNADYTKYQRLRMYVYGDSTSTYVIEADSSDLEMYLRFGIDSNNHYEFATAVYPEWDDRNHVDIDLLLISQLKARLAQHQQAGAVDSLGNPITHLDTVVTHPNRRDGAPAVYRVTGSPSMQQIKQLSVGVRNRGRQLREYSGQVYVDELRLVDARNDPGMAGFARVSAQLADFMDVDAQVDRQGESFRTLDNTGRKSADTKASLSTTTNLHRFLPGSWGFSIPVKATYNRTLSLPRFGPNSDVELRSAEKDSLRTESRKELYEISISKRRSQHWLPRWTIDQMNVRLSQTVERGQNPVTPVNDKEARTASFSYKMPLPKQTVAAFAWMPAFVPEYFTAAELRYLPTGLDYAVNVNWLKTANWRKTATDTTRQETFDLRETYAAKFNPLNALSTDYNLQINRDLRKKYDPQQLAFGREVSRTQRGDVKLNLRVVKWLDQTYGFQATYDEVGDPRRRRSQALIDSVTGLPAQTIDVTTKNTTSARINVRVPDLLKRLGAAPKKGRPGPSGTDAGSDQPFILRRLMYFTSRYVEPLNNTWRRNTDARNFNLVGRPPLLYQFGIEDSLQVRQISVGLTQQDSRSRNTTTESSTGLRLPLGMSVKSSYKLQQTHRSGSTQTRLRVDEKEYFPRLSLNWGRAGNLPYIKRFITSAQVNVRYDVSTTREGEGSLAPRNLITEGDGRDFEATWNGQWKWGPSTRIHHSRSYSEETDFELASNLDTLLAHGQAPPVRGRGENRKHTTSFETKYTLRPRELPLFGQLRSEIDLRFVIELQSEERTSATGDSKPAPLAETDRWKVELNGTYQFSENFRGEGIIRVDNDHNALTDRTRKVREVRLSGTLFFR
ncbi:cell surface protein SprA [Candidatus Latescibacterota bacterium]